MIALTATDFSKVVLAVLPFLVPAILFGIAILIGGGMARRHDRDLDQRELQLTDFPVDVRPSLPPEVLPPDTLRSGALVTGSVVVGADYFRAFAAKLRNLIGGNVKGFEKIMIRARREAVARMMEEARSLGAVAVTNLRLESSTINAMRGKQGMPQIEIIAFGTAIFTADSPGMNA